MKKSILAIAILAITHLVAHAASVTLAWDPNPEPDIAGYRIYWRTNGQTYVTNRMVTVTNGTSGTVSNLLLGSSCFFVATAYNTSGLESDYSNEVIAVIPGKPTPPKNLRTNQVIVKASLLISPTAGGMWAKIHTYDDVVFTNTMDTAFYQTKLAVAVRPAFESIGDPEPAAFLPPIGPPPPIPSKR